MNILYDFSEFLKSKNIKYSIAFGTLLGSIRHHGFIPWDDDVDIILYRDDFLKLLSVIKEFESERYSIVLPLDDSPLATPKMIKIFDKTVCIKNMEKNFMNVLLLNFFQH